MYVKNCCIIENPIRGWTNIDCVVHHVAVFNGVIDVSVFSVRTCSNLSGITQH